MPSYRVEEMNGQLRVKPPRDVDAPMAIQAASTATNRSVASGRNPDLALWIRVTDTETKDVREFHFSD